MKKHPLKVGFDLDGVLLYNPLRILRPAAHAMSHIIRKKSNGEVSFYIPKGKTEEYIWRILHLSSLFIAPGFKDLKKLVENGDIEAYLITARYACLKPDLKHWFRRLEVDKYFKAWYYNETNAQPHLHKEQKIKELRLDMFIEDNWTIVNYLHNTFNQKDAHKPAPKIMWIYNLMDRKIAYDHKFPTLKHAIDHIKKLPDRNL